MIEQEVDGTEEIKEILKTRDLKVLLLNKLSIRSTGAQVLLEDPILVTLFLSARLVIS